MYLNCLWQVIQGYELGVPGACEGETQALILPPHLAYTDHSYPGVIPGGATLHYIVTVGEIIKFGDSMIKCSIEKFRGHLLSKVLTNCVYTS